MLRLSISTRIILIAIIILIYYNHAFSRSKYYYSLASGINYNNSISENPLDNCNIIYPYFEFGKILKNGRHLGFNFMIFHNFENASDINSFYVGCNYKYFIIKRLLHFGGGIDILIEDEKIYKDNSHSQSSISIQNSTLLLNFNLRFGLIYNIWGNRNIMIDAISGQSIGKPYPYFAALLVGIFSYY